MSEESDDWAAAPKDGSVINVQFKSGLPTKARWNAEKAAGTGRSAGGDSLVAERATLFRVA